MTVSLAVRNAFRLRDIYHLKDPLYGGKCDGVTDDTAALVAVIAAMVVGGTLFITGTPRITAKVTVDKRINVIFEGSCGVNSSNRPSSYIIKASSVNDTGLEITAPGTTFQGGGVVAEEGNGADNIVISANSVKWEQGYSENAGRHNWVVDGASNNSNSWNLTHCRGYGATNDSFYFTGDNANLGLAIGCKSQNAGGRGFFSEKTETATAPSWNAFLGCGGDGNDIGIMLKGGTDNVILGGDFEGNTTADYYIDATERFATLGTVNRSSVIVDNSPTTRRLDRYRHQTGEFHPALRGASGTTKTATAVTINGATATVTSASHGYSNGDTVFHGAFANPNLNGAFVISNVTTDTYDFTYRTDASLTLPTSGSGLSVAVQQCGIAATAEGYYVLEDGVCEAWGNLVTSAVTNISGAVQLVVPFLSKNISADLYATPTIGTHAGITYTNQLKAELSMNSSRVANLVEDNNGTPGTPSQLQGTGLAAATSIRFHVRYPVDADH